MTFGPSVFLLCCSVGLVRFTRWFTRSGVRVFSVSCTLSLRALGCPTATSQASVVAARVLVARVMTSSVRPSTMKYLTLTRKSGRELGRVFHGEVYQRSVGAWSVLVHGPGVACAVSRQRVPWFPGVGCACPRR